MSSLHELNRQHDPYTCLSSSPHPSHITNLLLHYTGCIPIASRPSFFASLPPNQQGRIQSYEHRIAHLRARLDLHPHTSAAGPLLQNFKALLREYKLSQGRPVDAASWGGGRDAAAAWGGRDSVPPETAYFEVEDQLSENGRSGGAACVEDDIKAPVVFFRNRRPCTDERLEGQFPRQKVTVRELLSEDAVKNPLMWEPEGDEIRYIHLPANNMIWVEEAIARYYGEKRPEPTDLFLSSKLKRSRTKTEMLLRQEFWHGQQSQDASCEVHARNMRGMCDSISIDQVTTEIQPKNLVLFMPYLHWDTDRSRVTTANKIKEVSHQRLSLAEVLSKARNRLSHAPSVVELETIPSQKEFSHHPQQADAPPRHPRQILGQLLRAAAALLEAIDFHDEERLVADYLHAKPPLHPRRTLDQSYYGALKSTGTRDRDQVVYRATAPEAHEHDPSWELCLRCKDDVKKVSRLIMVDQLWLWILDEKTVISSFPRKWGKSRPDPSAIHKGVRLRLEYARKNEITSAYDLALIIIDEASRVFFDRTKTNDRQPNMMDMFADAIRGVTYKQTAAFDQFLIYTDLASREYKRQHNADTATQNHLLNINTEGSLLKEAKDIMDEIHIITRIKEQQQTVMESFAKQVQRAMQPDLRLDSSRNATDEERRRCEAARLTVARADNLLRDIRDRIDELNTLLENAAKTSGSLKDLLNLKQQQAGVIEAREAVKNAAETLKQGQSIMLFTVVTIIFLPLSFFATLFGMNSVEFNDGHLTLSDELSLMFPVSGGIILISFLIAFGRSTLSNSIASVIRNSFSLVYNTAVTWVMVKSGLYMLSRSLATRANQLRDRESKITGQMKAEVMREKNNLEKMKAASTMRTFVVTREVGQKQAASSTLALSTAGVGMREYGRVLTPRTPYSPFSSGNPASPFMGRGPGKGMVDVELGHRKMGSSQVYLVPERN